MSGAENRHFNSDYQSPDSGVVDSETIRNLSHRKKVRCDAQ
jgi:hypothetical protein